jgi:hypothetical protein
MDKAKRQSDSNADKLKRNEEMAEGKNPEVAAQIYKKGERYYCAECHSELPIHQDCPTCHVHLDWDRIMMERR